MMTNDIGKKLLADLTTRLFSDQSSPNDIKIKPNQTTEISTYSTKQDDLMRGSLCDCQL
jgi:hypothetical protein